jgi:hypothetical protein
MSDIQIVSADPFRNGWQPDGVVPYGTIFADDDVVDAGGQVTFESLYGVESVDWSNVSQGETVVLPKISKKGSK